MKLPIAVIASADGGAITQFVVHLWEHLSKFASLSYLSYTGTPVDPFVLRHVRRVEALLDPNHPESAVEVVRFLRANAISVVNLHVSTLLIRHLGYFVRLAGLFREGGIRIVATLHNVLPHSVSPVDPVQLQALYAEVDGFLVGTEPQRHLLFGRFDVGDRPVAVAPHGPYSLLDQGRFDRTGARRLLGLPVTGPLVLFFGYLRPEKGIDCLLQAVPLLRRRFPDASFLIHASTRYQENKNGLPCAVEAQARRAGILVRREFVPADHIEPIFRAADVLVLPYQKVTQSGALNLARGFRLPVVASEAFLEATHIDQFRMFPPDDPVGLADSLAWVLALSEAERRSLGNEALLSALTNESWEIHGDAFRKVVASVTTRQWGVVA